MKYCFSILFCLLNFFTRAQPGGGGGLYVSQLRTPEGKYIEWNTINLHSFVLNDSTRYAEIIHETYFDEYFHESYWNLFVAKVKSDSSNSHALAGGIYFSPRFEFYQASTFMELPYQRLVIAYKSDVDLDSMMIVDFIGIWMENGIGVSETLDTLIIKPGYYRYIHKGENLFRPWTIESYPKIDPQFRRETELPPTFYLRRGEHELGLHDLSNGYADVMYALGRNGLTTNEKAEGYITLTRILMAHYDSAHIDKDLIAAVHCATQSINLLRPLKDSASMRSGIVETNYEMRIDVYTKGHLYENALRDYDTLVMIGENKIMRNEDRALFKINYLHDYDGAIKDLNKALDSVSFKYGSYAGNSVVNYGRTFYVRGVVEFKKNEPAKAAHDWLLAMEYGINERSAVPDQWKLIDTALIKYPGNAELYLARAIGIDLAFSRSYYPGKDSLVIVALADLERAEKLGIKDYRINLWRSSLLLQIHKNEEALVQADIALTKSKKNPWCYGARFAARNALGQTKWGDQNDADLVKQREYLKTWKYEK